MKKILITGALAAILVLAASAQDAKAIVEKSAAPRPWKSMASTMQMDLFDKAGDKKGRTIKSLSKTRPGNLNSMIMLFQDPESVKGTGYLTIQNQGRDDDSMIYMPALRKVKRLAASGKGGAFMGSEFTFNEIGAPKTEDYDYKLWGSETVLGKDSWKIECTPKTKPIEENTGYSKVIRWIAKEEGYTVQADYFDRSGEKLKVLTVPEVQAIQGTVFSTKMVMENVQTGAKSVITFSNIKTDVAVSDDLFSERSLVKGW